jgi:ribosomal-protein-alanine N-acetyltransferase
VEDQRIRIERMTQADLPEVLEIERACFPSPWSRQCFLAEVLNRRRSHPLVARLNEPGGGASPVAGYACLWQVHEEIWINNLAVRADLRRRGLGRRLVREALRLGRELGCRQAILEVRPSNREAIRLYQSEGFEEISRRSRYYTDNQEDALVMATGLARRAQGRRKYFTSNEL